MENNMTQLLVNRIILKLIINVINGRVLNSSVTLQGSEADPCKHRKNSSISIKGEKVNASQVDCAPRNKHLLNILYLLLTKLTSTILINY
jgi:methyl coenzyme M reductase subunit D